MNWHIEGLDLAGKSTFCRQLISLSSVDWQTRQNALTTNNPIYSLANRLRKEGEGGEETVGWLYLAALRWDLEHWRQEPQPILQDSTILLRSLAYHKVRGTRGLVEQLEGLLEAHPRFDKTIVLVADHETRLARLAIRRPTELGPEDFLVRDEPRRFYAIEQELVRYATDYFQAIIIDSSGDLHSERFQSTIRDLFN